MENSVKMKRLLLVTGDSYTVSIPPSFVEFIKAKRGDKLTIGATIGKKGNYLVVYKEEEE